MPVIPHHDHQQQAQPRGSEHKTAEVVADVSEGQVHGRLILRPSSGAGCPLLAGTATTVCSSDRPLYDLHSRQSFESPASAPATGLATLATYAPGLSAFQASIRYGRASTFSLRPWPRRHLPADLPPSWPAAPGPGCPPGTRGSGGPLPGPSEPPPRGTPYPAATER